MLNVSLAIDAYLSELPQQKQQDLIALQSLLLSVNPLAEVSFFDGKNEEGKVVANPTIGFGKFLNQPKAGPSKEIFKIGISANSTGISIYILGISDKLALKNLFAESIGKATVTGYCIKFKQLNHINLDVLKSAITWGFQN